MNINDMLKLLHNINGNIYMGEGKFDSIIIKFNKGADNDDINSLKKGLKRNIPKDYEEFLIINDGITFFDSADLRFFTISEIIELIQLDVFKKNILPIGYFLDDYIVIDTEDIERDSYIYAGDAYCLDEFFR